jgi:hypothetical protein
VALELGCSFSVSFRDSFFGTSISSDFPSGPIYEFKPPTSSYDLSLLAKAAMKRDIS